MATFTFPDVNPEIKYVGVSKLRALNAGSLKQQSNNTLVIQENETPLSVLFSYRKYLEMREEFYALTNMVELLTSENERRLLMASFEDLKAKRVRSLDEIEAELESR